jgi:hypothetical protein
MRIKYHTNQRIFLKKSGLFGKIKFKFGQKSVEMDPNGPLAVSNTIRLKKVRRISFVWWIIKLLRVPVYIS